MKVLSTVVLLSCLLLACEKNINLNVEGQSSKLVVDAEIETGSPVQVVLTKSFGYFNTISPALLTTLFERNATVTISNGAKTHQLREIGVPIGQGNLVYFYTNDPLNAGTAFVGEEGKVYTLSIKTIDGKQYTATTQIPKYVKTLDSLWWQKAPNNPDTTKLIVQGRFTDPPGFGNYLRYYMKLNSEAFFPGYNSVFDDQFVDGTSYNVQLPKGFDKTRPIDSVKATRDEDEFFKRGDTVSVKFCNIDKATYDFWRTWEYNYQSLGSPFASPVRVINNIQGDALGNFSGYSFGVKTIIIPK